MLIMWFKNINSIYWLIIFCFLGACKPSQNQKEINLVPESEYEFSLDSVINSTPDNIVVDIKTTHVKEITINTAVIGGSVSSADLDQILFMGVVWADYANPTIEKNLGYTTYPRGNTKIESSIAGLEAGIGYYARTYVTTEQGTIYGNTIFFQTPVINLFNLLVKDAEGNEYKTVVIGKQRWMAANLRTSLYANGDSIPTGLSDYDWSYSRAGAYDVYPYEMVEGMRSRENMLETYGALYNWRAVSDTRGICPDGWRIPKHSDFIILEQFIEGGNSETTSFPFDGFSIGWLGSSEGNKLKSVNQLKSGIKSNDGKLHPFWDNTEIYMGTDDFGFYAVPAGRRSFSGGFEKLGQSTYFWSSSLKQGDYAWYRTLESDRAQIGRQGAWLRWGFSVRCIQDIND